MTSMTSPSSLENKKLSFGKFYLIGAMPEEIQVDFALANRWAVQEELKSPGWGDSRRAGATP